jgi:hypothetical protein
MARVYATATNYMTYTGQAPPANIDVQLANATRLLEAEVFRLCYYTADTVTGMPTDAAVLSAFSDAVCAQVEWWVEVGDSIGAIGVGWAEIKIGSAMLSKGTGQSAARTVAPKAWDALQSPDVTPDKFRSNLVVGW